MEKTAEKTNVFMKIVRFVVPWKGDSVFEIIRKIIFIVGLTALIVIGVMFLTGQYEDKADNARNDELREIYNGVGIDVNIPIEKLEELEKKNPEVLEQFLPLLEVNEEIAGWLTIGEKGSGFYIDYPVLQTTDNDYYLTHSVDRLQSRSGALFADYRNELTAEKQSANVVVYGHNMAAGTYFGLLPRYFNYDVYRNKNDLSYYKNYPTLTFSTLYKTSTYKIFAGMLVKVNSGNDDFLYHMIHNFSSKAEFDGFCAEILDRSTFITPDVDLKYGDNLITLSTCILNEAYGVGCEKRWVLFAREVREGESEEVDVSKAYSNPSPLFFDEYYKARGGKWEGRGWTEDIIAGYNQKEED
ncbi:MAG: class B sortase [Oscillospiraceae bacterium]|nr:class B sortase [Oscillospiraceae bacterium]